MAITDVIMSKEETKRLLRYEMNSYVYDDIATLEGQIEDQDLCVFRAALYYAQNQVPLPPFHQFMIDFLASLMQLEPGLTEEDYFLIRAEHIYDETWRARLNIRDEFTFHKVSQAITLPDDNCNLQAAAA